MRVANVIHNSIGLGAKVSQKTFRVATLIQNAMGLNHDALKID